MEEQFKYIVDLAKQYKVYVDQPTELYRAINALSENVLNEILNEYGDPENRFQPVNLLRAESARQLLNGVELNELMVEEIKDKIRTKKINYFNHLSPAFLEELNNYPLGKRDMFANWQKPWNIFHTFFYRLKWSNEKGTVQTYLDQIGKDLLQRLDLKDYTVHSVDFQGATNFGSDWCWIALYPITKYSHKHAYQFFIRIGAKPEAGRVAGFSIKDAHDNIVEKASSYSDILKVLQGQKAEIIKLNNESRNYFKFAPGSQASEWSAFHQEGIAAVSYNNLNLGDISDLSSHEQINEAAGLDRNDQSNRTWNLWLFKTANIGDVIFVNKGVNSCIGIGIIEGEYYYDKNADVYKNRRKVKWLTDKVYQYKGDTLKGYKTLFRPDTFSPTNVWEFLLNEYVRIYPDLAAIFKKHDLKFEPAVVTSTIAEREADYNIEEELKPINFWWLNANPKIWSISSYNEGDRQTYTTHNEKGNKRRIYKYFEEVKPNDLIVGYESTPTKQIKGIHEITKGIHTTENGEEIEFELVEKLEVPIPWNELKHNPALENCEVFKNNQGSLFRLTEEEYDIIRETIDNKNIIIEKLLQTSSGKPYNDDNTELLDLFAKVLINASKLLLKRGIDRNYIDYTQELTGLKGKLELSQTLKSNLHLKQRTLCTFDDFSANILINQILVSTLYRLIKTKELDKTLKKELKSLLWLISGIEPIEMDISLFKKVKLNRNNHFYGFVMNVCQIIYENSLLSEEKGIYYFSDFTRDEKKMNQLFEAFIRNFYRIELKNTYRVKSEIIKSANLYQLFSYLLNQEKEESKTVNATGILLYPTIEQDYDLKYQYNQHPIFIKTLNLNTNWRNIENRLKEIAECSV